MSVLLLNLIGSDSKTEARKGGKKDSKGKPETAKKSDKKVRNLNLNYYFLTTPPSLFVAARSEITVIQSLRLDFGIRLFI